MLSVLIRLDGLWSYFADVVWKQTSRKSLSSTEEPQSSNLPFTPTLSDAANQIYIRRSVAIINAFLYDTSYTFLPNPITKHVFYPSLNSIMCRFSAVNYLFFCFIVQIWMSDITRECCMFMTLHYYSFPIFMHSYCMVFCRTRLGSVFVHVTTVSQIYKHKWSTKHHTTLLTPTLLTIWPLIKFLIVIQCKGKVMHVKVLCIHCFCT